MYIYISNYIWHICWSTVAIVVPFMHLQGWARMEYDSPSYVEFATFEWASHGVRAEDRVFKSYSPHEGPIARAI